MTSASSDRIAARSDREVAHLFEIGDQSRSGRAPSEPLLCLRARRRKVKTSKHPEKTEVSARLFGSDGNDRHLQAFANRFGDVPKWYAFFADRVISGS